MAFQIKDFASIVASSINWMRATTRKVTDFNVGSVARTLIEAPAAEMDHLYMQMLIGLKEAIPVSVYNSFDFARQPAKPAAGLVRLTVTSSATPTVIAAGTSFTTVGKAAPYLSTADVTIAAGNTFADIPVACSTPGAAGNLPAASAFTVAPTPSNFVSASNTAAFISGLDEETDEQRKLRFNSYIAALNRSTVASLVYGAKTAVLTDTSGNELERVTSAVVIEPWVADNTQPVGWARVYIHNGSGGTSGGLVTRAREILYGYVDEDGNSVPGWKAAGVQVDVLPAVDQLLNVTGVITSAAGYDHAAHIVDAKAAISAYLYGLGVGEKAIRSEIIARVMDIEGIYNFTVSAPAGDTTPAATDKIMPGTLAIT